ncbi:MAG: M56 family metallopeptidase [Algoriphagus sp.]|nr:M56 family metallopeptidase [Algoriphagus sp.]
MIVYLLKSALCLFFLLLIHRLVLQREAMHQFNRYFLLIAVAGSFLIPLISIEVPAEAKASIIEVSQEDIFSQDLPENFAPIEGLTPISINDNGVNQFNWQMLLWIIYGSISLVFLIRFLRNINLLQDKIRKNIHLQFRGETLILIKDKTLPFSFLSYIFVSKNYFETGNLTDAIFAHEQAHVHGKHSWDILFIEAMLVLFWFHPGLYYARQAIKLNHEFIADQSALTITSIESYKNLLLSMMLPDQKFGLASNLNFSLTKKRFEMLKRKTALKTKWAKISMMVPILGVLVYFFSEKVIAEQEGLSPQTETESFEPISTVLETNSTALSSYNELNGMYQVRLNGKSLFAKQTEMEMQELYETYILLLEKHKHLSYEDKRITRKPIFPFARLKKDEKVTFKHFEDLTEEERKSLEGC